MVEGERSIYKKNEAGVLEKGPPPGAAHLCLKSWFILVKPRGESYGFMYILTNKSLKLP